MDTQEFEKEQLEFLQEELKEIKKTLLYKMNKPFKSDAIPEEWKQKGDHRLMKAVIHSFCRDGMYQFYDKEHRDNASNLHKFI